MNRPQKNIMTDGRMHDIAMQMKGTPVSYPKPTRMQRFKKWLLRERRYIFMLCFCVASLIVVVFTAPSATVSFFLSLPIGVLIGIILIDMFDL